MRAAVDVGWRLAGLALAWLAGVAVHLQMRALAPLAGSVAAIAVGVVLCAVAWRWRRAYAAALLGVALVGWGASGWRASLRLADELPAALEGQDLSVSGVIASLPQRGATGLRFRFDVDAAAAHGQPVAIPRRLALGWYGGAHEDATMLQPPLELRAGQRWRFTLRLRRPHGNMNPHGYDYELLLFEQGVRATGYVRDAPAPELLERAAGYPVERLRQRLREAIFAAVADPRAAGVLAALAVGDQGAIERDDWDLYRNTGIAHLVSISGLHITMFAWMAGGLIAALWRSGRRTALALPAPLAARWGGLLCAAGYAYFSGWGVPSQRTVWMLGVVTALQACGLRWPSPLVLLLAAVVVTGFDPWALQQAGFWLSFVAVGLLLASAPVAGPVADGDAASGRRGWASRVGRAVVTGVRTQAIATLGLAPLTLIFFQQISLVGFAANLLAIPMITLAITPLALLGCLLVPLWPLAAWGLQRLNGVLATLAAVPGAVWLAPVASPWAQFVGLVGAVLIVLPLPRRARALGLPMLLPMLWPAPNLPAAGEFALLAVDVGQGTAVLVRTRAHLLVFDAGPQYSRDSDAGRRILLPLLRARGERRIDTLVLSHRDVDHVGGAAALLSTLPVGEVLSSLEGDHPLQVAAAGRTRRCEAGQTWQWDGVNFAMLRPEAADYERRRKPNAMSCVLRVAGGAGSALLTGDIEREQEEALRSAQAGGLRSDVLIVPHHGSRTSSSAAFLDAVAPRLAVFQAGYRNRFGHPAPDVLARYVERGIEIRATPACGAFGWGDGAPVQGVCQRDAERRYWHYRPADGEAPR
jgi:competence protein ComEC